jgi:hypothetical protein
MWYECWCSKHNTLGVSFWALGVELKKYECNCATFENESHNSQAILYAMDIECSKKKKKCLGATFKPRCVDSKKYESKHFQLKKNPNFQAL